MVTVVECVRSCWIYSRIFGVMGGLCLCFPAINVHWSWIFHRFSDFPCDFPRSTWLDILYELQTSPNIPKQFTNVWCYFEMKAYNIYIYSIWKLYNLIYIYICVCDSLSLYIWCVCVCLAYMKVFLDQSAKPSTMSCYFYFFWVKAIAMQSTCFDGQEKRYLQLKWLASACVGYMLAILPSFLIP